MTKKARILLRAAKGAAALLIPAGIAAAASPEFREFVGDDWLAAIIAGAAVPALLALEKALELRRNG